MRLLIFSLVVYFAGTLCSSFAGATGDASVADVVINDKDPNKSSDSLPDSLYTEITTPRGIITAQLFYDKAPLTVTSFVGLAEGTLGPKPGKPFFDDLTFHRVVPGFVIQGGDPLGTGDGGPGYEFPDEFLPGLRHDAPGVLSMANDGPDTNGSQFFITLSPQNQLNYLHSVFGKVVRGLDVLPQVQKGDKMQVKILRIGEAAKKFRADPESFEKLIASKPRAQAAHFDDPDLLLPSDPPRAKGFNNRLSNLERFTGVKVFARIYAKFQPTAPDQTSAQFADSLANKFGVSDKGVAVVYFADTHEWDLCLGKRDQGKFTKAVGEKDPAQSKKLFLDKANTVAEASILTAGKSGDKPLSDAQKMKLRLDAVLNDLIDILEPKG
jgi:cyclophilin family peptidyl-prolyl cis-trans isomerase